MQNSPIIVTGDHPDLFPAFKKLHKEINARFCPLSGGFTDALHNLDLPAKHVLEAAQGMDNDAFRMAAQILAVASQPITLNGVSQDAIGWMQSEIVPYLYPRMSELVKFIFALDKAKPSLVILQNDVEPLNRTAALWAKARNVPCLHVPHAIYQMVNRGELGSDVHDLITASYLAVGGYFQRDWYQECGAENIRETGLPKFDKWKSFEFKREKALGLLDLSSKLPVVVYASTWGQSTNEQGLSNEWKECYLDFLEAVKEIKGIQAVVKCHPGSGPEGIKWHIEQAKNAKAKVMVTATHLPVVLKAADVILAYGGSNVLLDAAHVGNARLMTIKGFWDDNEVWQVGPDIDSMIENINTALNSPVPDYSHLLYKYCGVTDGKANERIAEYAMELIGGI